MAPPGGPLVPMAMRIVRQALKKTSNLIRTRLPESSRPLSSELQPVAARNQPHHPIHPAAYLRQSKGRWYTTHNTITATFRRFSSAASTGPKFNRSSFPKSVVGSAVTRLPTQAPFATTLRPNLTGGALPRSAGGYGLGGGRVGGARYFSHTPALQAQVVNNVSAAVRAFWLSGQKVRYDGMNPRTGEKRYKAISALQERTGRTMKSLPRATPGSFVDFQLNPVVTALSPLSGCLTTESTERTDSLNTEGLLDILSADFSRSLKDLSAVLADLRRLSKLGDLSLTLPDKSTLRVHFPGCDASTVENLCKEVGAQRGIVHQDSEFDTFAGTEIALLFPFASSRTASIASEARKSVGPTRGQRRDEVDWTSMITPSQASPGFSVRLVDSLDDAFEEIEANPWLSSPSGYSSTSRSDGGGDEPAYFEPMHPTLASAQVSEAASGYEGLEGIYRFLGECDAARR
ncbi:hypothetical protein FGG08_005587 [Glutinoglossum americanum]|uniref:Casein kinase II beta 2 subunit n=1 Tax=Glutinoglossum americanum TaxID=1670608 RepID=A0A9P8I3B1_9PEZI|nr:hypothetical protein FGG08_005587 [Glutinoglossum americanum]